MFAGSRVPGSAFRVRCLAVHLKSEPIGHVGNIIEIKENVILSPALNPSRQGGEAEKLLPLDGGGPGGGDKTTI